MRHHVRCARLDHQASIAIRMSDLLTKYTILAGAALILTAVWCEALDMALGPEHLVQPLVLGSGPLLGSLIAWDARRLRRSR
jgi:hypothetical protein